MRINLVCPALAATLLVAGCGSGPHAGTDPGEAINAVPPPTVTVVHPVRQTIQHTLEIPGDVDAWYKAKLYAKVAGYLKTIAVDKGDHVTQGQVLATIDSPELQRETTVGEQHYQAAVAAGREDLAVLQKATSERDVALANHQRALAQVREAQAAVVKAQGDLDLANTTYTRIKTVYDKDHGLLARQEVDVAEAQKHDAESKLVAAREALAASRQNVASCSSSVDAASGQIEVIKQRVRQDSFASSASRSAADKDRELYAYTEIRAPFSGSITARYLDPGALVQDSATSAQGSAQPVLALQDTHVVRIYVQVPQSDVRFVHHETAVTVRSDELPDRTWKGHVTRLSGAISEDTRTMLVEIDLPNGDEALRPGMMVSVRLQLATHANVLTVPTTALLNEAEKRFVFTESDGKVHKVEVQTGFEEPTVVEIKSGLTGTENVVSRIQGLKDGATVQLAPAATPSQQAMK